MSEYELSENSSENTEPCAYELRSRQGSQSSTEKEEEENNAIGYCDAYETEGTSFNSSPAILTDSEEEEEEEKEEEEEESFQLNCDNMTRRRNNCQLLQSDSDTNDGESDDFSSVWSAQGRPTSSRHAGRCLLETSTEVENDCLISENTTRPTTTRNPVVLVRRERSHLYRRAFPLSPPPPPPSPPTTRSRTRRGRDSPHCSSDSNSHLSTQSTMTRFVTRGERSGEERRGQPASRTLARRHVPLTIEEEDDSDDTHIGQFTSDEEEEEEKVEYNFRPVTTSVARNCTSRRPRTVQVCTR